MKWEDTDIDLLTRLYCKTKLTAPEIAQIMGRGKNAVRMKITVLGLGNERRGDLIAV